MSEGAILEEAVKRGHDYAWSGEWEKAIAEYSKAAAQFPENPLVHSSLGLALFQVERLREALREYRLVSELRPDDLTAQKRMAEIYEALGRKGEAAQAWEVLAGLYEGVGVEDEALEAWREVARLRPESEEALAELAEAHTFEAPQEAVQEYLALARLAQSRDQREVAEKHCRRALALDEGNIEARELLRSLSVAEISPLDLEHGPGAIAAQQALARLAESLLGEGRAFEGKRHPGLTALAQAVDSQTKGEVEKAIEEYELALQEGVRSDEVIFSLAMLWGKVGRCDQALPWLKELEGTEYALAAHFDLGECYLRAGETQRALGHLLEALKMADLGVTRDGDLAQAYDALLYSDGERARFLADSLIRFLGSEGWEKKVASLRERVEVLSPQGVSISLGEVIENPQFEDLVEGMTLVWGYQERGMPFTALEECYQLVERAPDYLPLHLLLGGIFLQQEKIREAVEKYASVAKTYLTRGVPRRAISLYKAAAELDPMDTEVRQRLIDLLIGEGEVEEALEGYMTLAESDYRLARVPEALEAYEAALRLASQSSSPERWGSRILRQKADLNMQRADWKGALSQYREIKRLEPDDERVRQALVELCLRLGQPEKGYEELEELMSWYRRQGESGLAFLQRMVEERPEDMELRQRLAESYFLLGMKEEAVRELDALGEQQLAAGLREEAKGTIRLIISLEPDDVEAYRQFLERLGD